ncbi:hypothetical protein G6F46_013190 [Rhizopus delemar]|nr:hypothetical protein RO3G_07711 [Rhizopus delemar RA 99-880]KAG1441169.1 hypothetical protein G6F55_013319 [Rhizopus delemar]KAG1531193.1 hypothetical protein G6F51_013601 [Rhizopus arrhizus]KAG1487260.1 hypothetical protein G6F54_012767 [Rhizopus delemar]KAG1490027.1 hypothetical protein G6F53_013320 [Rhizopus delemar]|eukprot:EIE83006.1 hypothetical protein RO3G_07711 [Rhizopus delemar RA 99-880]
MSAEEDGTVDEHGKPKTFLVRRPTWRSRKLNNFFDQLDAISKENEGPLGHVERVVVPLELEMSEKTIAALPRWGFKKFE